MGIFNILKKKDNNVSHQEKKDCDYKNCITIVKIISHDDDKVIKEIERLVDDPITYFNNHKSEYSERWINNSTNIDAVIWTGLVDCLIRNNYACERGYNDELEDFIFFMNKMNYDIKLDKELLNEDGYVAEWCAELDKKLQVNNLCIGGIDIDSDSFVMFICENDSLEKLRKSAQSINHKITLASEL